MKILVTGAAGFIGHALSKRLLSDGHTVMGLDNINDYYSIELKYARLSDIGIEKKQAEQWGQRCISEIYEKFSFIRMNLEDREKVPHLFAQEKFDVVINLAAQAGVRYSIENPESYIDSNIVGFLNILEACRHNNIKHLVYASSSSVYGANTKIPFEESDRVDYPVSLYAATKKSNELMAHTYSHLYGIPTTGLRFFTVYGPWGRPDMAPMLFANAITKGTPIKVFNHGDMKRDFTYIDDIVEGVIIAQNNPPAKPPRLNSQIFNIGNGAPVNLLYFIEVMEHELGLEARKEMLEMQPGDVPATWADTSLLKKIGFKSKVGIEEGVQSFVKWFKKHNDGR